MVQRCAGVTVKSAWVYYLQGTKAAHAPLGKT